MSDKEESNDGITVLTNSMELNHIDLEAPTASSSTVKRKFSSDGQDNNPSKKVDT